MDQPVAVDGVSGDPGPLLELGRGLDHTGRSHLVEQADSGSRVPDRKQTDHYGVLIGLR